MDTPTPGHASPPAAPIDPFPPADHEAEAARGRAAEWGEALAPGDPFAAWLVDQVCIQSLRVERCQRLSQLRRDLVARRVELFWEDDRRAAAEALAVRLPRDPVAVVRDLRKTKQGCEVLIGRWEALAANAEVAGAWCTTLRWLALDLMGVAPEARVATPPEGAAAAESFAARMAIVADQIARLRALADGPLADLDRRERAAAAAGALAAADPELDRLHRYERTCARAVESALAELRRRGRRPVPAGATPDPAPVEPVRDPSPAPPPAKTRDASARRDRPAPTLSRVRRARIALMAPGPSASQSAPTLPDTPAERILGPPMPDALARTTMIRSQPRP